MADPRRTPAKRKSSTSVRKVIPITNMKSGEEPKKKAEEDPAVEETSETAEVPADEVAVDEEAREENRRLQEKLMRLQAEFDNYRKRQARDFRRLCSQGKRDLIVELLAVLDNYHRAEKLVEEGGHSVEEIAGGLMKTSEQLISILNQEGLKELGVEPDDDFDPNIHEAMLAEDREGLDRDTVLEVFQKGYRLGNELLRPARVKVGKSTGDADKEEGEEGSE
ncbi:MAG: nucleotide exchange factor GrpE [Candidatus Aegiribacteria sp.]|nr:nucleotide exchange factor GrpE [Candidatus Aegiribacteria sp.]MBD3295133.1 nucleotide exchange factor GrpE [Candidatus Fermentibacteria bacterium]